MFHIGRTDRLPENDIAKYLTPRNSNHLDSPVRVLVREAQTFFQTQNMCRNGGICTSIERKINQN